jgi:hypothetical protein
VIVRFLDGSLYYSRRRHWLGSAQERWPHAVPSRGPSPGCPLVVRSTAQISPLLTLLLRCSLCPRQRLAFPIRLLTETTHQDVRHQRTRLKRLDGLISQRPVHLPSRLGLGMMAPPARRNARSDHLCCLSTIPHASPRRNPAPSGVAWQHSGARGRGGGVRPPQPYRRTSNAGASWSARILAGRTK